MVEREKSKKYFEVFVYIEFIDYIVLSSFIHLNESTSNIILRHIAYENNIPTE